MNLDDDVLLFEAALRLLMAVSPAYRRLTDEQRAALRPLLRARFHDARVYVPAAFLPPPETLFGREADAAFGLGPLPGPDGVPDDPAQRPSSDKQHDLGGEE